MKILGDVNIAQGSEIINADIEHGISDPATGSPGKLFYRTDLSEMRVYDGSAWSSLTAGGGSGSVTSIDASTSAVAALSISGVPITSSGTIVFTVSDEIDALAQLTSSTGFVARIATASYALRTVNGTSNRISITNSDGVNGNVSIDVSSSYAGQASISTLGTITSGVWHATTLATGFGGTGRTSIGSSSQILGVALGGGNLEYKNISQGTNITITYSSGDINIALDSAYTGQTSINTLGTITTGAWHGSAIDINSYTSGTLPIDRGGTGQITSNDALNAILPSQTGNAGSALITDGTNTSWAPGGTGTVTSIDISTTSSGLNVGGGPITSSGTLTVNLGNELQALAGLSSNGFVVRTGVATYAERMLVAGGGISISNPDGVAGNITITNGGITNISGTTNQIIVSLIGGAATLSLPQNIATSSSPTFASVTISNTPSAGTDAATKGYVDSVLSGLDVKQSVRLATNSTLPAYSSFGSGSTKTLTGTSNGALSVDSVAVTANDRILVKNEGASNVSVNNGIYVVNQTGDVSHPYILARASDADSNADVTSGIFTFVSEGTSNSSTGWVLATADPITLDTTALFFTLFSSVGTYTAGTGISVVGTVISNTGVLSLSSSTTPLHVSASTGTISLSLDTFGTSNDGIVSASGGGTTNYLRADGTWDQPPGTTLPGGSTGDVQFNSGSNTFSGDSAFNWDHSGSVLTVNSLTLDSLTLKPVSVGSTSTGNTLILKGGPGGNSSGAGGDVTIIGGTPFAGAGGNINVIGADGVGSNKGGGSVFISSGNRTGSGTPGSIFFKIAGSSTIYYAFDIAGNIVSAGQDFSIVAPSAVTAGSGANVNITAGDGIGASTNGSINLIPGTGATGGGGAIYSYGNILAPAASSPATLNIIGGKSTTSGNTGGSVVIVGGQNDEGSGLFNGSGGSVFIKGGNAVSSSTPTAAAHDGGNVYIIGGAKTGTGTAGTVTIGINGNNRYVFDSAGNITTPTDTVASAINILGGISTTSSSAGGAVNITAGTNSSNGQGGTITVSAGAGVGTDQNGGNIIISGGVATGSGVAGSISLGTDGNTQLTIDGTGAWLMGGSDSGTAGYVFLSNGAGAAPSWQPVGNATGSGTVTGVTLTTPSGLQVSGGSSQTINLSGTFALTLTSELSAVQGLSTTGLTTRTGSGTWTTRTVTAGSGILVSNGNGISGNPTITNTGLTSIAGTSNQIDASGFTGAVTLSIPSVFVAPGSIQETSGFLSSFTTGITATGSNQSGAAALTTTFNIITTTATNTGVILPSATSGRNITVINRGANALNVYPATGATIDNNSTNAAVIIPTDQSVSMVATSSAQWYVTDPIIIAGTGLSATPSPGTLTLANTGVTSLIAGSGISIDHSTGNITVSASITSVPFSGLTDSTQANTVSNANYNQTWEWALTSGGTGFSIIESAASTGGSSNQTLFSVGTLSGSTAYPFSISAGGNNSITISTTGAWLIGSGSTAGINGQILLSGGPGLSPSWGNTVRSFNTRVGAVTLTSSDVTTALTYTPVNKTGDSLTGTLTFDGTHTVTGLPNPSSGSDAATKTYVDNTFNGLSWKNAVTAATTVNLSAVYSNGTSGIGATLTNSGSQAAFAVDSYSASANDRILVKNQTTQTQNGIYTVTTIGSGSTNWVLTRSTDTDVTAEMDSAAVYVENGTSNATTGWIQTTVDPIIGTNNIVFIQFTGAGTYSAGTGLTLSGTSFSLTSPVAANLGGTGTTTNPSSGQVLVGTSSNTYAPATIGAGTGISTTTGSGTLTINNTGITSNVAGTGITVSEATGDVTISISTSYTGQTSITTLGTIGTGTWHGSIIASVYGGTGQSSFAVGDVLYADTTTTLAKLSAGTSGKVLTSNGANSAPSWQTLSTGSTSPLTTKGDLWGYDTANNRIPVGTDGQILTADSTQTLGVKWSAAGATGTSLGLVVANQMGLMSAIF